MKTMTKPHPMDAKNEAARAAGLYVPPPTRMGQVPPWLTTRLREKAVADERARLIAEAGPWYHANPTTAEAKRCLKVIDRCAAQERRKPGWSLLPHCGWMDHDGSSTHHGREIYVSEPYHVDETDLLSIAAFATTYDLDVQIEPLSWHNSGSCIRIEFSEKATEGPTP